MCLLDEDWIKQMTWSLFLCDISYFSVMWPKNPPWTCLPAAFVLCGGPQLIWSLLFCSVAILSHSGHNVIQVILITAPHLSTLVTVRESRVKRGKTGEGGGLGGGWYCLWFALKAVRPHLGETLLCRCFMIPEGTDPRGLMPMLDIKVCVFLHIYLSLSLYRYTYIYI